MAFYVDWTEKLQATRKWLQDVKLQGTDPQNWSKKIGALDFLNSSITGQVIETDMMSMSRNSQYMPVQIRYIPHKGTGNLVTSDSSFTCTGPGQRRDILQTVQPTKFAADKFEIDEDYVRQNAENGFALQQRLNKEFRDAMRVVRESIDAQCFAELNTDMGANPAAGAGAGSFTSLALLTSSDGTLNVDGFDTIKNHQMDNFSEGTIGVIGLGNYRKYINRLAVGSANERLVDPAEMGAQFGQAFFPDHFTTSTLGNANYVLAVYPGSAQFFSYLLNRGADFQIDHGGLIKGTMPDPIYPGLEYDYDLYYDRNCTTANGTQGSWVGRVWLNFDVWTVDSDAYGDVYGSLNDFNGIVGYNITSA